MSVPNEPLSPIPIPTTVEERFALTGNSCFKTTPREWTRYALGLKIFFCLLVIAMCTLALNSESFADNEQEQKPGEVTLTHVYIMLGVSSVYLVLLSVALHFGVNKEKLGFINFGILLQSLGILAVLVFLVLVIHLQGFFGAAPILSFLFVDSFCFRMLIKFRKGVLLKRSNQNQSECHYEPVSVAVPMSEE